MSMKNFKKCYYKFSVIVVYCEKDSDCPIETPVCNRNGYCYGNED